MARLYAYSHLNLLKASLRSFEYMFEKFENQISLILQLVFVNNFLVDAFDLFLFTGMPHYLWDKVPSWWKWQPFKQHQTEMQSPHEMY